MVHAIVDHIHPFLEIFLEGQEVTIPTGIGLEPTKEYSPHTHDAGGKLHIGEGLGAGLDGAQRYVTLKDFFDVWRSTNVGDPVKNNPNALFDSTHLMNKVADATHSVFMTVNGVVNTQYETYIPEDGDRIILSYGDNVGSPVVQPLPNSTLLVGSPLVVPIDGLDPQGQTITYTVTSSNPLVTATVTSGNPSWRMTVDGFGDMVFQLFQDKAPRPVNRVVTLTNQGFYNGLTFHRILNNFVIQGGDPSGDGTGGSNLGNFDDQFNVDLQHNRTGLLSFAKSSDDTNNSQFFITEGPQRHLDFNHSIFGVLTEGESVRDAISNVPANASTGVPTTPVTIEKAVIFNDNQNGAVILKAAAGATGTSTITVTARDPDGHTAVRTFTVTLASDTSNGGPFLNDIPAVRTSVNTPATFQLTSQDVEGNAVTYAATKGDSLNSTVTVNATTGQVTATPPTGFVGTMLVRTQVSAATGQPNDTGDKSDVQVVAVTVAPAAPTGVDLVTASDSGASNSDNITNVTSPSFLISGVTSGSVVKLYNGTTVLGQATATGTTVTITVDGLAQASYSLKATQTTSSLESDPSAVLAMVVDTAAPSISSTAPTTAKVGAAFSYDVQSSEEGNPGLTYSLINPPGGATINAATGVVSWTPTSAQLGAQTFGVSVTDAAGNVASQNISVTVADADLVALRLAVTDSNGNALTSIPLNGTFQLRGFVQDIRTSPKGVFAAYYDVLFPSDAATVNGTIDHGAIYTSAPAGDADSQGLNEIGGSQNGTTQLGGPEQLLFIVPMKATKAGTLTFTGDAPDQLPVHAVLLHGVNSAIPNTQLKLGTVSVNVASPLTAGNDTFNVDEDSAETTLNVLANDSLPPGSTGTLKVTQVGTTNHGGTVAVPTNGLGVKYRPAANFNGAETFTYTVSDGTNSSVATVTATVHPINDPPTAVNDTFSMTANSVNNILDVLQNDLSTPDTGETLKVTAVGSTPNATLSIGPNGSHIVYAPRNGFTGADSFTYTISDGNGGTATATANVTVSNSTDPPVAGNDAVTVAEDSTATVVNVLANDSPGTTPGETVKVSAVGTPDKGGTVTVGTNGANVLYTPAANFNGTEKFTYTVTDGNGGFATGTVTATVTSVNDPPNAVDDTATVAKDASASAILVLANDTITPDTGETLTVQAITQGAHGTVAIAADNKSVTFTPTTGYTGSDSFTYTISDGNGGTDTATVTVNVVEFIPSSIAGTVFLDINNDGVMQTRETPLAAVTVALTGTATGGQAVQQSKQTDAQGRYEFSDLAPGSYVVRQSQPPMLVDGKDVIGSQGGTVANDTLTITIAENTHGVGNNFAELRNPAMVTIRSFLARNHIQYLYTTVDTASTASWNAPGPGWTDYSNINTQLTTAGAQLKIDVVPDSSSSSDTATLPTTDPRLVPIAHQGTQILYRLDSGPEDVGLQPPTSPNSAALISPNGSDSSGDQSGDTELDGSGDPSGDDSTAGDTSGDETSGGEGESRNSAVDASLASSVFLSSLPSVTVPQTTTSSNGIVATTTAQRSRMSDWFARPRGSFSAYRLATDQLFADL